MNRKAAGDSVTVKVPLQRYAWVVLAITLLAQTAIYVGGHVVPPLAPFLQDELGLSRAQIGVLNSAFYIGAAVIFIPAGWAGDAIGVRLLFLIGMALEGLAIAITGWVGLFGLMFLALFVAGLGDGLTSPSTTKAIMEWFPVHSRGTAMGIKQTGTALGGAIAAAIAPPLALAYGWRSSFVVIGSALSASALLTYAVYRDRSPTKVAAARPTEVGSVRQTILRKDMLLTALFGTCSSTIQFCIGTYLVLFLTESMGMSVVTAGGYLAAVQLSGVAGRVVLGMISDSLFRGSRKKVLLLESLVSSGLALVVSRLIPGIPEWQLFLLIVSYGFAGIGWFGLYATLLAELAGTARSGLAAGFGLTSGSLGIIIGPPIFGLIVDRFDSYAPAWQGLALLALIAFVLLSQVRERPAEAP